MVSDSQITDKNVISQSPGDDSIKWQTFQLLPTYPSTSSLENKKIEWNSKIYIGYESILFLTVHVKFIFEKTEEVAGMVQCLVGENMWA